LSKVDGVLSTSSYIFPLFTAIINLRLREIDGFVFVFDVEEFFDENHKKVKYPHCINNKTVNITTRKVILITKSPPPSWSHPNISFSALFFEA